LLLINVKQKKINHFLVEVLKSKIFIYAQKKCQLSKE